jgi:Holliday junction resolvase
MSEDDAVVDTSLDRLDSIERIAQPAKRGAELERFVADVFRQHHFTVRLNAGVARPRQTDVLASRASDIYLIECKWRSDKANIDDLDSLRSRLRRTDGRAVGILVSVPGFSGSVLHDVEHHREQPILLISGDELRLVARRGESVASLLWRKREALSADGTVLLDEPAGKRTSKRRRIALPSADGRFLMAGGVESAVVECQGTFGQFIFSHELPDIDWVPAAGLGVTLDVGPVVCDERELLDLVGRLAGLGWATSDARWSIQQATRNWHGLGCAAFADELPHWRRRANIPQAHHSEEICYLDRCDGGFYTLTAKLAAHTSRQATFVHLSFQLQGIPLDTAPLLELCRSVGAHDGLYFRTRAEESVTRRRLADQYRVTTQPINHLVMASHMPDDPIHEWVTGVVIANPFHGSTGDYLDGPPGRLDGLRDSEQLICALRDHHPNDGRRRDYRLSVFEYAQTSDVTVCRPIADWKMPRGRTWRQKPLNRQAP